MQGLPRTIRLFILFRSLNLYCRSELQQHFPEFLISLESFSLCHSSLVLSNSSFVPSCFLAERDESCGLICGSAAKCRIHLVFYEICTIKSVILLEK